jgi:transposase
VPRIADSERLVTGGVDTHAEVHVAGVVDQAGRVLGTAEFPATAKGYQAALEWMDGYGELVKVGVEAPEATGPGWPATLPPGTLRWWR